MVLKDLRLSEHGVIWDRAPIGKWLEWQYKGGPLEQSFTLSGKTKLLDSGQFVIMSVDWLVSTDKTSGQIMDGYQSETICTYTVNPDSSIGVHSTSRIFDCSGQAKFDRVNDFVMEKIAEIDFPSLKYLDARREFFSYWLKQTGYLDNLKLKNQTLPK